MQSGEHKVQSLEKPRRNGSRINSPVADVAGPGLPERSYRFAVSLVRFVVRYPGAERGVRPVWEQLIRSGTSIGANVAEARSASSRNDFLRFFEYALKSANETVFWLRLVRDGLEYDTPQFQALLQEAEQLCRILGASTLTLKGKRTK